MRIRVLGSGIGRPDQRQFAQTFLVNDLVAIDAGCLGFLSPVEEQKAVRHVFLSHSHLDHVASLPFFLDNVYELGPACPTIYGSQAVLESLRRDFFNERVWPDLLRMSREETPFLRTVVLTDGVTVPVEDLTVMPVAVRHVVPTMAFVVGEQTATVGLVTDTLPTDAIWRCLAATANLKAVFLEVSFPNALQWLADKAGHLTPQTFQQELAKLNRPDLAVIAIHLKPTFYDQIARELQELELTHVEIAQPDRIYEF